MEDDSGVEGGHDKDNSEEYDNDCLETTAEVVAALAKRMGGQR